MEDLVVWLLTGAILGAVSIPVGRLPKPRLFWGSAWADPTSISWMLGFLLYGPAVAFVSSVVGAIGIWKTSPELTPALGAALKFVGTACVWATGTVVVTAYWGGQYPPPQLGTLQMAVALALLGGLVRAAVIVPLDYFFSIPYYRSVYEHRKVSRREAMAEFGGIPRYIVVLTFFNLWLSLFDLLVPWAVLYPTGLTRFLAL